MDGRIARLIDGHADGVARLHAGGRDVIVKRRADAPPGFFAAEARGLDAIRATVTLRVPEMFAVADGGIVLEDLGDGRPAPDDWLDAGRRLAAMHGHRADVFGFPHDGWCGDSPQENTPDGDGHRFFAESRLLPQARRARDAGRLDRDAMRRIERICERLPDLVPVAPPVLVHGDLWTGNLHACADGALALIDGGAVHHGWAETDLAMLALFGAPPAAFFDVYQATARVDDGWRDRADLLNLYPLLNHLNLFGEGYLAGVQRVLSRWS